MTSNSGHWPKQESAKKIFNRVTSNSGHWPKQESVKNNVPVWQKQNLTKEGFHSSLTKYYWPKKPTKKQFSSTQDRKERKLYY